MSNETTEGQKVEGAELSPEHVRRDLEVEFNVQRAKMKELFLQKEEELRKLHNDKEQLESEVLGLRAQLEQLHTLSQNQKSEIQSLQLLVSETVEASSSGSEEARRLRARNHDLEQQLGQLRHQAQQQEVSLAPATLVRNLARKLGADAEEPTQKKNVEDTELVRSIVQPLEQEIAALKHKLRETDAQLQEELKSKATSAASGGGGGGGGGEAGGEGGARRCDMCVNYEKQLVGEQARAQQAVDRALAADKALKQAAEELEGVRRVHEETLRAWRSAAPPAPALHQQVAALRDRLEQAEREAAAASRRALATVTHLTVDRETLQRRLDTLERDNAMLIGRYLKKAEDMQNEIIDLPDNVEELQELTLKLREQLIFCQIGREEAVDTERELRTQLLEQGALFHQQESELNSAREQLTAARKEVDRLQTEAAQLRELGDKLRQSNDMIENLLEDKKRLSAEVGEVRGRVSVLQQELDNSEKVQQDFVRLSQSLQKRLSAEVGEVSVLQQELDNSEKVQQDFVRLSQSLQVQLQRFRSADTEVRWQHDDDVTQCPACHTQLNTNKKKVHCRHCGRIFCPACVCHAVPSGPRGAPARVCAVCRTLLDPAAKPYFSTQPPHSPD